MRNKEQQRKASRKHYESHRDLMKQRARSFTTKARERNRLFLENVKRRTPCADCGFSDHRALAFHHLSNKVDNLATAACNGWSLKRLQAEINKCVVLCANCHQIRHYEERKSLRVGVGGCSKDS